jgi:hypothetical protein
MKILFTGMATSHVKDTGRPSFFTNLRDVYKTIANVETVAPSTMMTDEYLESYDAIFVGLIPPTSPSANYLYGCLDLLNRLYNSPKLYVVVDNDQLWNYKTGFTSIAKDVSKIFTPFLSRRKEFTVAKNTKSSSIQQAAEKMSTMEWPKTIHPELPWGSKAQLDELIGRNRYPINIDSYLLTTPVAVESRKDFWFADTRNKRWVDKLSKLVHKEIYPVKENHKESEASVEKRLSSGLGVIIPPVERNIGTWWSTRYIQALNSLTPIYTDWKDSRVLSPYWDILPVDIEALPSHDRLELARKQRESYISAIPSKDAVLETLMTFITTLNKETNNA